MGAEFSGDIESSMGQEPQSDQQQPEQGQARNRCRARTKVLSRPATRTLDSSKASNVKLRRSIENRIYTPPMRERHADTVLAASTATAFTAPSRPIARANNGR